ncbi:MAG: PorP/SprF family type IX secretion system membrane protein [Bacteroidetes bacterium]|nr:PorP/SprF family type IX secretion system membrane protein [Bacteroidota bacterium]
MRICLVFFLLFSLTSAHKTSAQNYPMYNGYFLNPFIYNPAAAATEQVQLTADYRKQWVGVSGAPSVSSLTASTLINETRAGIGFKVSSISRGFLNTTEASASYAYGVPFDHNNRLFFGLSAGMLSNRINFDDLTKASDPALGKLSTSMVPTAAFGMLWKNSNGFDLGFTMPKLISDQNLDANYSFSYADNLIVTASFSRWNPKPKLAPRGRNRGVPRKKTISSPLELFTIYRYSKFGSLFEGTAKYNFSPNFWFSASYRQFTGIIPAIGIVTDNLTFSYFYEPGLGGDLPLKTHEVLLKISLGQSKKYREKAPTPPASKIVAPAQRTVVKKPEPVTKPVAPPKQEVVKKPEPIVQPKQEVVVKKPEEKPITVPPSQPVVKIDSSAVKKAREDERKTLDQHIQQNAEGKHDDTHNQPVNERHDFVKRGTHHEELDVATYVIAGAFQSRTNAEHYAKTLKSLGYEADFGHLSVRKLWYVFIAEETEVEEAKKERNRLQKNKIFSQVWLLTVQP